MLVENPQEKKTKPDWVAMARSGREEWKSSVKGPVVNQASEELCPYCKNTVNTGATTCAHCGAFKYTVESRIGGLLIGGICFALLSILFFGAAGLGMLLIPFVFYGLAKRKERQLGGWAPPRDQWGN
ncbi:MAG: hypothetical protein GYB52_19925 [Rhodospirillales bacterium]|nr:hypothetical protein [Rhodospirillales bacterium]